MIYIEITPHNEGKKNEEIKDGKFEKVFHEC